MEETGNNEVLTLPMVALRNMVVMPGMMIHFDVRRKFSVAAVENAMRLDQRVFCVAQHETMTDQPEISDLYPHGTVTVIKQIIKLPDDVLRVLAVGGFCLAWTKKKNIIRRPFFLCLTAKCQMILRRKRCFEV